MNDKTYAQIKTDFQERYFKFIKPELDKYENKRASKYKCFVWVVLPLAVLATIIIIIVTGKIEISTQANSVCALPAAIAAMIYMFYEKNIELEMKKEFMPIACKCFDDLTWTLGDYPNPREFEAIGLLEYYNNSNFDDIFKGVYKDSQLEIIEATFYRESVASKDRRRIKIFEGIILKITTPKDFLAHTIIRPDSLIKFDVKGLKRTELEDVVFEKKYDVYTNDPIEARVVITPAFMERINNIQQLFCAEKVACCFKDKCMYISLYTGKDMFKLCSLMKPLEAEFFVTMFKEIMAIYRLIDYLKVVRDKVD